MTTDSGFSKLVQNSIKEQRNTKLAVDQFKGKALFVLNVLLKQFKSLVHEADIPIVQKLIFIVAGKVLSQSRYWCKC